MKNGGGVKGFEGCAVLTVNGQKYDFSATFQNIWNSFESALQHYYTLAVPLNGEGYTDFSSSFADFERKLANAQSKLNEINQIKQKVSENEQEAEKLGNEIKSLCSETSDLKNESEKSRKNIAEYEAEVTQKLAAIREVSSQAETLKASVKTYKDQFESFQGQMDEREEVYKEGKNNLEQLIKDGNEEKEVLLDYLKEVKVEIDRLNKQAEDMLKGATVAGLASSFGEIHAGLVDDLDNAKKTFYLAMCLLFISALPLVAYVVPGMDYLSFGSKEGGIGQIIIRAILLLPAAWFAKFCASRHASLFRLKEHYAYKYSVASSVEGFKKQAEPFKDAIAAASFFELTFNPANQMENKGHEQRHPNMLMDWIMKKLGATYDGKSS